MSILNRVLEQTKPQLEAADDDTGRRARRGRAVFSTEKNVYKISIILY